MKSRLALILAGLAALAACQHARKPGQETAAAPAAQLAPAPEACRTMLPISIPVLTLPDTDAPPGRPAAAPALDIAQIHTVNRPLQDVGVWADHGDGWSVLLLQLGSKRARSITVRLRELQLPQQSQVWLCSADGSEREGPLVASADAEIWPKAIPGTRARVEVWVPTPQRATFSAVLADAYGGYR